MPDRDHKATIRVLMADDHPVVVEGVAAALFPQPDIEFLGAASNPEDLIRMVAEVSWDVLLLDLQLGGADDAAVLKRIRSSRPEGRVLVYTAHRESSLALHILRAGADGFLSKDRSLENLVGAIRTIHSEGRFVPGPVATLLLNGASGTSKTGSTLTARETSVLMRLRRGQRPSEIADSLGVGRSTVSTYINSLKKKLGASSHVELAQLPIADDERSNPS